LSELSARREDARMAYDLCCRCGKADSRAWFLADLRRSERADELQAWAVGASRNLLDVLPTTVAPEDQAELRRRLGLLAAAELELFTERERRAERRERRRERAERKAPPSRQSTASRVLVSTDDR
jgi:hypothetical protein